MDIHVITHFVELLISKELTLPKESSDLCLQLLGGDLYTLGIPCLIRVQPSNLSNSDVYVSNLRTTDVGSWRPSKDTVFSEIPWKVIASLNAFKQGSTTLLNILKWQSYGCVVDNREPEQKLGDQGLWSRHDIGVRRYWYKCYWKWRDMGYTWGLNKID